MNMQAEGDENLGRRWEKCVPHYIDGAQWKKVGNMHFPKGEKLYQRY